ncbi:MAG: hypothetical protein PHR82_05690, partial [Endomicrobiaceae bacterium]|nr:hypothetical protein [Endomicrobiaceae bacterium]
MKHFGISETVAEQIIYPSATEDRSGWTLQELIDAYQEYLDGQILATEMSAAIQAAVDAFGSTVVGFILGINVSDVTDSAVITAGFAYLGDNPISSFSAKISKDVAVYNAVKAFVSAAESDSANYAIVKAYMQANGGADLDAIIAGMKGSWSSWFSNTTVSQFIYPDSSGVINPNLNWTTLVTLATTVTPGTIVLDKGDLTGSALDAYNFLEAKGYSIVIKETTTADGTKILFFEVTSGSVTLTAYLYNSSGSFNSNIAQITYLKIELMKHFGISETVAEQIIYPSATEDRSGWTLQELIDAYQEYLDQQTNILITVSNLNTLYAQMQSAGVTNIFAILFPNIAGLLSDGNLTMAEFKSVMSQKKFA